MNILLFLMLLRLPQVVYAGGFSFFAILPFIMNSELVATDGANVNIPLINSGFNSNSVSLNNGNSSSSALDNTNGGTSAGEEQGNSSNESNINNNNYPGNGNSVKKSAVSSNTNQNSIDKGQGENNNCDENVKEPSKGKGISKEKKDDIVPGIIKSRFTGMDITITFCNGSVMGPVKVEGFNESGYLIVKDDEKTIWIDPEKVSSFHD